MCPAPGAPPGHSLPPARGREDAGRPRRRAACPPQCGWRHHSVAEGAHYPGPWSREVRWAGPVGVCRVRGGAEARVAEGPGDLPHACPPSSGGSQTWLPSWSSSPSWETGEEPDVDRGGAESDAARRPSSLPHTAGPCPARRPRGQVQEAAAFLQDRGVGLGVGGTAGQALEQEPQQWGECEGERQAAGAAQGGRPVHVAQLSVAAGHWPGLADAVDIRGLTPAGAGLGHCGVSQEGVHCGVQGAWP